MQPVKPSPSLPKPFTTAKAKPTVKKAVPKTKPAVKKKPVKTRAKKPVKKQ